MMDRQGVEIDYCPKCRGVWLDRGELDKIIERSASAQFHGLPEQYDRDHHNDYREHGEHHLPNDRKREGFLKRMLDFG
jgi:Zn-finger nucleic acid-binding protein